MYFVFDVDGTICFNGKTIEPKIIEALHKVESLGHNVVFASARPIRDLLPVLPKEFHQNLLVGGNGCFTSKEGQIQSIVFTTQCRAALEAIIQEHKLTYLADSEWDYAFTGNIGHPIYKNIQKASAKNTPLIKLQKICKLVLFYPTNKVIEQLKQLPIEVTAYKSEQAIDISPIGIHKVAGLRHLEIKDFVAFGNDANDQCMFEHAIESFCVGPNSVKQFATHNIHQNEVAATILAVAHRYETEVRN